MCSCSLGPAIRDFDPGPVMKKWLEAPFCRKLAEGGALTGSLTSSLGFMAVALGRSIEHSRSAVLPCSSVASGVLSHVPSREIHRKQKSNRELGFFSGTPLFLKKCLLPGERHRSSWGRAPGKCHPTSHRLVMNIGALPRRCRPQVKRIGTQGARYILKAPYLGGLTGA